MTSSYKLPPADLLKVIDKEQLLEIFDHLFEHSETLSSILLELVESGPAAIEERSQIFTSYSEFIGIVQKALTQLIDENPTDPRLPKIIASHPRLGEKKVNLSAHSQTEQRSLSGDEKTLQELNSLYEQTFPGLRYVTFVNGRPRKEIMENMRDRIARNDYVAEEYEAVSAMCDIALDRASKLL